MTDPRASHQRIPAPVLNPSLRPRDETPAVRHLTPLCAPAAPAGVLDLPAAMLASGVPGALWCPPPAAPIVLGGVVWTAEDAWGASIGLALAVETVGGAE